MEDKKTTELAPYRLRDLLDGGTIDIITEGNISIPLSLDTLSNLVAKRSNDRNPTPTELMMFANTAIEQKCNPYLKEL